MRNSKGGQFECMSRVWHDITNRNFFGKTMNSRNGAAKSNETR